MIQEDISSLSNKLLISLISLQKMPMDQVRHLSDIASRIPDFFQGVVRNIACDKLVGKILPDACVFFAMNHLHRIFNSKNLTHHN